MLMHEYVVYIIRSIRRSAESAEILPERTYVGITNNVKRRLRQHNQELKGGARYTRGRRWSYAFVIGGLKSKRNALVLEWCLKHCRRGGRTPLLRRLLSLHSVLSKASRWTKRGPTTAELWNDLWIWWCPKIFERVKSVDIDWSGLPLDVRPSFCIGSVQSWLFREPATDES